MLSFPASPLTVVEPVPVSLTLRESSPPSPWTLAPTVLPV